MERGRQTVRAFCRGRELAGVGLLFLAQAGATWTLCPRASRARWSLRTPSFLPVHVVKPTPDVAEGALDVEIVLGQGRTVRVRAGFDRQTLADVLTVLEARPC